MYQATPAGYVNPNLINQPTFGPRLLPGQVPGMSLSYPTFIPGQEATVAHESEQASPWVGGHTPLGKQVRSTISRIPSPRHHSADRPGR